MKRWSLIIFAVGIISGLILISLATWADQEASLFELTSAYDKNLPSLGCPLMISRDEESFISVNVKNPSTYQVNPLTTAHITSGYILLINEFRETPSLPPGGEVSFSWPIKPSDAAYNTLVLARVFVERSYPLPSRTGSCGVLVLPFGGIPGKAVSTFLLLISLAGMTLGLVFWRGRRVLSARESGFFSGLLALAGLTIAGFVSVALSVWLIGLACVILILLISIALATRYWGDV
ncbi:MAG: hypothetical protein HGA28_01100 [Anaerolineaceae bacterium]|nr:hypothetical protein [Anaerolineaceae bacterium]